MTPPCLAGGAAMGARQPNTFLAFDVESIGLQGEGFAVGWVMFIDGICRGFGLEACPPEMAKGRDVDRDWVADNVPRMIYERDHPLQVRDRFWYTWRTFKDANSDGFLLVDCGWPVEANFLSATVRDATDRLWDGPYPLVDLSTLLVATGLDPLQTFPRMNDELPAHQPLNDARQTARLWMEHVAALASQAGGAA